jgi:GPH family glycoside/pentoside/hexuronide:cation symporter
VSHLTDPKGLRRLAHRSFLLGWFGFVANQQQTPETIQGLRLIMSWIPAAAAVLAGVAVFFYKIDAKTEKELEAAMLEQEQAMG